MFIGQLYNEEMLIRKAFKYRLKTNKATEAKLTSFAGATRFVWNKSLSLNLERLKHKHRILRYQELNFWLKLWKDSEEYGFLKEVHSQALQQKLQDLDKAFMDAFDKSQPGKRLPRFKKKAVDDRFRYPQGFKIEGNRIFLPKIGWVGFFNSRKIVGIPKNITISRRNGHWFVSIQTEYEMIPQVHPSKTLVGIDMGIARFVTLSTGEFVEPKNSFRALEAKLKAEQQRLSKKQKFSNNWKKQKSKVQRIHTRITDVRKDYLHWHSNRISKNHAIIAMEELQVSNMSRSSKGDIAHPGRQVKAKSGLNKSILDQGWFAFRAMLKYKQEWRGGEVLLVNPKNTSITCPSCHYISKENRQTQSEFVCKRCSYCNHADWVGAINIERAGHARLACGAVSLDATMKQESTKAAA